MMEAVTADDGTAPAAQIEGYRVAGKTGTAWRVDPTTGRYIRGQNTVSFMGFAPADNPRFLTYIVLDKPYSQRRWRLDGRPGLPRHHVDGAGALRRRADRLEDPEGRAGLVAPVTPGRLGRVDEMRVRPLDAPGGPSRAVGEALPGSTVSGDATVTGISLSTRDVVAGDLYAALPGATTHGVRFAAAGARGAVRWRC